MSRIKVSALIELFEKMYSQGWEYVSGGASEGAVDCSGAFTYAFRKLCGLKIDHGSNSIYHKFVEIAPEPRPGYAAFKVKDWTEDQSGNRWYGKAPGNVYHIGLVDKTGRYILNAKGTKYGFCKDRLSSSWTAFGKFKNVDYGGEIMSSTVTGNTATVNTASGSLNVRDEASKNGKIVGKLSKGTSIEILQENGDWTQIRYGDLTGWCAAAFLQKNEDVAEKTILITDSAGNTFQPVGWFRTEVM